LPLLFLTAMSGLFARTSVSLSTSWFHNTVVVVISKYYVIAVILKCVLCYLFLHAHIHNYPSPQSLH
jgi:hypothetical protein